MKCRKSKILEQVRKKPCFFQTKAQGLPMNVIIIAIILIIVLVLVIFVFNKQWFSFSSDLESCKLRGGDCSISEEECKKVGAFLSGNYKECPDNPGCCIKFPVPGK